MIWKCNQCELENVTVEENGKKVEKQVENGYCPACGPVQTTPIDEEACKEAGVSVKEEETETAEQALN